MAQQLELTQRSFGQNSLVKNLLHLFNGYIDAQFLVLASTAIQIDMEVGKKIKNERREAKQEKRPSMKAELWVCGRTRQCHKHQHPSLECIRTWHPP